MTTSKNRTCNELGVCQGCFGKPICADCDQLIGPQNRTLLALPKHPFAPGTIEGPTDLPVVYLDDDGPWQGLTIAETITWFAIVMGVVAALAILAGYLVERLA